MVDKKTYHKIFPTADGQPPVEVTVELSGGDSYREKEAVDGFGQSTKLAVSIKGIEHPYAKILFPGGCNYAGDAVHNPATLRAVGVLVRNLQRNISRHMNIQGVSRSIKEMAIFQPVEIKAQSANEMAGAVEFNPSAPLRSPHFIKAGDEQINAVFDAVTQSVDALAPAIEARLKEDAKLQPPETPGKAALEKTRQAIQKAFIAKNKNAAFPTRVLARRADQDAPYRQR